MPFNLSSSVSLRRDKRTLPYVRIAALDMLNLAALYTFQILSEIRNCRLLDELKCKAIHRLDACLQQALTRAVTNPRHKDRDAIIDGANYGFEAVLFPEAPLAVVIHSAMADKLDSGCAYLVYLKLSRVAEVLVNAPASLGGHRYQDRNITLDSGEHFQFGISRRDHFRALSFHVPLIGLTDLKVIMYIHLHHFFSRELVAPILTQQSHSVGAALAAVAHHVHLAFARILQCLQLLRSRTACSIQPENSSMLRRRDQGHDVVQEGAARFYSLVDLCQMMIIDTGNHD